MSEYDPEQVEDLDGIEYTEPVEGGDPEGTEVPDEDKHPEGTDEPEDDE